MMLSGYLPTALAFARSAAITALLWAANRVVQVEASGPQSAINNSLILWRRMAQEACVLRADTGRR